MCFKESIAYFGAKNNQTVGKGDLHDTCMFRLHLSNERHEAAALLAKSLTERHERLLAALKPDEQEALVYGLSALIRALRKVLGRLRYLIATILSKLLSWLLFLV